jgi:hypothetical protein
LAREVDGLRRDLNRLDGLPERVDELAVLVSRLAESVSALLARKTNAAAPAPSWLMAPADPQAVDALLAELTAWLGAVYLRYPDGADGLPECWCWHPDVVEELLWLMHAWTAAYQGSNASGALAGDWHERQRPGVVRRINARAGTCSRENHQTRPGWGTGSAVRPGPTVPAEGELGLIAAWWGTARDEPAPEPEARAEASRMGAVLNGGGTPR